MDLIQVIGRLLPILAIALAAGVVVIGITYSVYIAYRKRGGERRITSRQFIASFLILGWFVIVMTLTAFSRGANYEGWINLELFSGYINAWNKWSVSEFQLIIFNMLMFAPLGFLLPHIGMKTRHVKPVLLISLLVTLGIEIFQMITGRGIFELDDILHNTIGSIAGYLLMRAILDIIEQRRITVRLLLKALCIPLVFTLLFSSAFMIYYNKELGNLSIRPAISQNMNQVKITFNTKLPDEAEKVSLYRSSEIHNMEYAKRVSSLMKDYFGLHQKGSISIDGYNRVWSFVDNAGREYTFNYDVNSGTWSLSSNIEASTPVEPEDLIKQGQEYGGWLIQNDLLSQKAIFSTQNGDTVRWDIRKTVTDVAKGDRDYDTGLIMIVPSAESMVPQNLFYSMNENIYVRVVDIISPAEAYEEILKGNFSIYNNLKKGDELNVNKYELTYTYDSKGYYQPVYQFEGEVDGVNWNALIPAVMN
ncbi:VanZ family protein [Paenibacillus polymyxa]|uniref:VanZ family protein n=1 Tax=Paenibacillus polymyxa TaxID=1406 RepID=UPI001BE768D3|nr:VanZ family protein [Paenibacillus polymyxa]MBT2282687.1 VanZ family protein [Paenibacillus polymyxa]